MKKDGKCVHYNGTVNNCCEAGVNYRQMVGGENLGWAIRTPCFADHVTTIACDKLRLPTAEEIAADKKAVQDSLDKFGKAREAIVAALGGPWKKGTPGASGSTVCPNCQGTLHYSRAGSNGHIHARCSTANCVAWME